MKLCYLAIALSISLSALAQNYPEPGSTGEPPVVCTGCPGNNFAGEPNDGKPTMAYDVPVVDHVGRYVDSVTTPNIQHAGIRTIRAGIVRVNASNDRVYLKLGSAIGAYNLETFFTGRLAEPMAAVGGIQTGSNPGMRNPLEKAARIDGFIYPEAARSGWQTPLVDSTERLEDFDTDDRGYVYYQSNVFGWGVHRDDGRTDGKQLPFVSQVPEPIYNIGPTLFTMKSGQSYYAYTSDSQKTRLYDVTDPAAPVLFGAQRNGQAHWAKAWSKNESAGHVAVIHGTSTLRVYTYAALIAGAAPLTEHVAINTLADVSFDEAGNLWVLESSNGGSTLWKLAASTYEKTAPPLDGASFRALTLHAAAGHIAIAGTELIGAAQRYDLRLLKVVDGAPEPVSTGNYFRDYYHAAPSGFAQPASNTGQAQPFLFVQNGLTYLFYSAFGLGDVYELGEELRPPTVKIASISPATGPPAGGTVVTIIGRNFGQDAVVSFDGTAAATTFVSANQLTAVAPSHAVGFTTVFVSSSGQVATGPKFTYMLTPTGLSATATGEATISLSWNAAPHSSSYEVFRDGSSIGMTTSLVFTDAGRTPDTAHVYFVRAVDAALNRSPNSNSDVAVTTQFTDASISPGMKVKAVHLSDVRMAVNVLRVAGGLPVRTWTASARVLAVQLTELRTAVTEARAALGVPLLAFTDATLAGVPIKAVHMQELMNAVR